VPSRVPVSLGGKSGSLTTTTISETKKDEQQQQQKLSSEEEKVFDFVKDLSLSDLPFRIVVVGGEGNAILESTQVLGPKLKVNPSPKRPGENLLTVSSDDASFEYHLRISQVASIAIIEKPSPVRSDRIMRLVRFLNDAGQSLTSFIVADGGDDTERAEQLFQELSVKYGNELMLR
jgi:hypothetical protein